MSWRGSQVSHLLRSKSSLDRSHLSESAQVLDGELAVTVGLVLIGRGANGLDVALLLINAQIRKGSKRQRSASKRIARLSRRSHTTHVVDLTGVVQEVLEKLIGVLLLDHALGGLDDLWRSVQA